EFPVELSISAAKIGNMWYAVGMLRDITERKRAEKEIDESSQKLKKSLEGTIHAIASAEEMRDPYTAGHQDRVAEIACAIGQEMALKDDIIEGIQMGGKIHDIGKIHLPSEILSKPTRLTEIEYLLIQGHSQVGYDILKDIDFPWPVADIAHQHHERMDGSGYPQGLKGEEICLEARIVAVADVVEAMTNHRPYRPGLGIEKALAEIERGRGSIYDTDVADACLHLFREHGFTMTDTQ
ncbi:MAG: HD domain-containing phosphohydrolase, partial [Mariprofundus sp.]|nr:HD domain-containing phosphohydrolase [Mariprofundus sp.]